MEVAEQRLRKDKWHRPAVTRSTLVRIPLQGPPPPVLLLSLRAGAEEEKDDEITGVLISSRRISFVALSDAVRLVVSK
ncbi:hypothetical protein FCM35_KLT21169 [Carex littledalei]|uniref:Uncharacterized protein n=1 Tax=Carex littledalei TaxID=544730 RepID=A0A833QUH7_9POAL|nr:hypothetical protein FCM35_KLT21169 [Carex littledalei]